MAAKNTAPYLFEPVRASGAETSPQDHVDPQRIGHCGWCTCGHCTPMATAAESVCCRELPKVLEKVVTRRRSEEVSCVTQLSGFSAVCLDTDVLQTAYFQYKQEHGAMQASLEEKYRYTAYRQFVRWCHGTLGRNVRVPLPACAVARIRHTFNSASYRGFLWPEL